MLSREISAKVLTIGPDFEHNKGGIPTVIRSYSKLYDPFHFIPTYFANTGFILHFLSLKQILLIALYLLQNRQIQIIHIHGASKGSFYRKYVIFLLSKYLFGKRVIYHIHSGAFPLFYTSSNRVLKLCIRHFVENAETVICLSETWKQFFSANFNPKALLVLPNIVEKVVDEQHSRKESGSKVIFLFLGMIRESKGTFDLAKAAAMLPGRYKDRYEVWIGGDGDVDRLQSLINTYELKDNMKYLGWLDDCKKKRAFEEASVLVLPSHFEGSPVSILEAMSYGMPVISTSVGGIPDLVFHNYNGFLHTPGDVNSLLKNMQFFIDSPARIGEFGIKSLKIIKKHYKEAVLPHVYSVYRNIL